MKNSAKINNAPPVTAEQIESILRKVVREELRDYLKRTHFYDTSTKKGNEAFLRNALLLHEK